MNGLARPYSVGLGPLDGALLAWRTVVVPLKRNWKPARAGDSDRAGPFC